MPANLSFRALATLLIALSAPAAGAQGTDAARGSRAPNQPIVFITGSTDGLGREVARRVASSGAHVIVHGRNRERGTALVEEIQRAGEGSARFYAADLASLERVRELGQSILRDYDRLNVLVNNAGIWIPASTTAERSTDGHEMHFAVNYLSGFLLTRMLLPLLEKSAPARIVNVASLAQSPIDFDNVMLERGYSGSRAYGQSKLAQIMFTFDLARELEGSGISVFALHPATLMNTPMVANAGVAPRSTVEEGVEAVMKLITAPGLTTGQFFNGLRPARANAQAYDEAVREKLRQLSLDLTGAR